MSTQLNNQTTTNENLQSQIESLNVNFSNYLPLSGGTMTGVINTNVSGIATSVLATQASTIPVLIEKLRYCNGAMGSHQLTEAYTLNGVTIAAAWYNYLYIPHRVGGASIDNGNYGCLFLMSMTSSYGSIYLINFSNGSIASLTKIN